MPTTSSQGEASLLAGARAARRGSVRSAAALALALCACLEYSPHAIPQDESHRDVHRKSLERLLATPEPAALRFAVVGDTQGDFDEVEELVSILNREDLSLVIQVGDFTHQGLAPEFTAMNDLMRRLRVPYFVVIGNHDLLGNGGDIYDHVFGERNLAFTYAGTRFVLFDSNAVEYGYDGTTPDLDLLRAALSDRDAYRQAILFSHLDPEAPEWDPLLKEPYFELVREEGVQVSFYGHGHAPREYERDGGKFYVVGAVDHRTFIVATVLEDGTIAVERRSF